ncbi:uncharacterized protein G2W53_029291 [Senna tora]|uniref:Uncharacterized protein n=1 Tax=Senna tora TaxID=362788 RepID=A0A834T4Y6_9FABA|nr:uncharacterized protein G2W53_029291 [Senna tora]
MSPKKTIENKKTSHERDQPKMIKKEEDDLGLPYKEDDNKQEDIISKDLNVRFSAHIDSEDSSEKSLELFCIADYEIPGDIPDMGSRASESLTSPKKTIENKKTSHKRDQPKMIKKEEEDDLRLPNKEDDNKQEDIISRDLNVRSSTHIDYDDSFGKSPKLFCIVDYETPGDIPDFQTLVVEEKKHENGIEHSITQLGAKGKK